MGSQGHRAEAMPSVQTVRLEGTQVTSSERRQEVLQMKADGMTYAKIGQILGICTGSVVDIMAPPSEVREALCQMHNHHCQACGAYVGKSGQAHHAKIDPDNPDDISNFEYLCLPCHTVKHARMSQRQYKGSKIGVAVSDTTKALLCNEGHFHESYDDVLKRLLEELKQLRGKGSH